MVNELKAVATATDRGEAFRNAAAILAKQGKWRAAVTALGSPGDRDDASRLLLAYLALRAGDPGRADEFLRAVSEARRRTLAAHWVAAELALDRDDAATAAEELESGRAAGDIDAVFRSICCGGRTIDPAAVDTLLRGRVALLRDDVATAVRLLREVRTPEGRLFFARALKAAGQSAEAVRELATLGREVSPCDGVWREHVLFEAALAASGIDTASAEALYQEAVESAETQELAFSAAVSEAKAGLETPLAGLFIASMRSPSQAAPESRNNLGHLLIARANGDIATLAVAEAELRKAARSRDYATPQYAYIGLARAALAAGDPEDAATEVGRALWLDPDHDEALEIARALIRDAPIESRLRLGVEFTATTSETLPRRFVAEEYGRELTQLDETAASRRSELARHFAAVRALANDDFERARRLSRAARTDFASADWPDAVEAVALVSTGNLREAQPIFRALQERVSLHPPRTPWEAATLRTAALAFSSVAKEDPDPAARAGAAALMAEVARPAVASGRPFPWEPRTALTGIAVGEDRMVLPGTTITVFTEEGSREVVSDADGRWDVHDLPPGAYSVLAVLSGMQSVSTIAAVTTGATEIALALKAPANKESITVTAGVSEIDPLPQVSRTFNLDQISGLAPGVAIASQVYGGSAGDNQYVIDGADVTDVNLTGTRAEPLLSSAIQEITVVTSGYNAEYGRTSGLLVNGMSRSGTNEFEGKVSLEAGRDQESAEAVAMPRALASERDEKIARVRAGGPLQRDRLYWFASADLQQQRGEPQPALTHDLTPSGKSRERIFDLFTKLSRTSTHTSASLSARTRQAGRSGIVDDAGGSAFGTATAVDRLERTRNDLLTLAIERVSGAASFVGVTAVHTRERSSLRPGSDAGEAIQIRFPRSGFFTTGGVGFINDGRDYERTSVRAKGTVLLPGRHDVSGGIEAERDGDALSDRISGGVLVDGQGEARRFWTYGDDPAAVAAVHEKFEGDQTSAFLMDTWRTDRLTANAGLRWTRQTSRFPRHFELSTSALQPRVGIAYDPDGSLRWKLYADYGRFFESIERDQRVAYGSDRRYVVELVGTGLERLSYGRLSAIDPGLRARLSDVWAAGVEHGNPWYWQLGTEYRRLASHIEDFFCTTDRRRCIGNPGIGIMAQTPRAKREELYLLGRLRHQGAIDWELAYSWLRAETNMEPPDLDSTRVAGIDPYARPAFDTPALVALGSLPLPRHSFRASAFFTAKDVFPTQDVVLSATLVAQSGAPRGAFGYSPLYGRYATTLVPRGNESDGAGWVSLDAGIDYIAPIGKARLKLSLIGRNLLGSQTSVVDDQRALLPEPGGGTLPNPAFLQPMERNAPRNLRAVVALTF